MRKIDPELLKDCGPRIARFFLAVLGGAIPFGGGVFSGAAGAWSEAEQERTNKVVKDCLQLHQDELKVICTAIAEVLTRLDSNDESIKRIESRFAIESEGKAVIDCSLLVEAAMLALREKAGMDEVPSLQRRNSGSYPSLNCILPDDLMNFISGEALSEEMVFHLKGCAPCRTLIEIAS